jgi:hypothetical protein
MGDETGPWRLVRQLQEWAVDTTWVDWLELAGSLGRGAGDEESDVDAGIGVTDVESYEALRDQALDAARGFAPVAEVLVQPLGHADHLVVQYVDGRQLSLVVLPAAFRTGLPPGAVALLDRRGALADVRRPGSADASPEQLREWAFLGWWGLGDVAKHARRGRVWRAITSLNEVRDHAWRLHAARLGVDYPVFGAVSVENADLPAPQGIAGTLPTSDAAGAVLTAAQAMARVLTPLTQDLGVDGLRAIMLQRLDT